MEERGVSTAGPELDPEVIERLQAVASLNRLRLLQMLREPRTIHEIELEVDDPRRQGDPMTEQGVRHHLGKLRKGEFVRERRVSRGGRRIHEYETDPRGLYQVAEFVRELPHGEEPSADELETPIAWEGQAGGPSLTLVHGPEIGATFPLTGATAFPDRGWVLGSASHVDVSIPGDPHLDPQAAEVQQEEGAFRILDLRGASSRAAVDGVELDRGGSRTLASGDVVGVGRCLLVFREGR